jgi:hypothetical protein
MPSDHIPYIFLHIIHGSGMDNIGGRQEREIVPETGRGTW